MTILKVVFRALCVLWQVTLAVGFCVGVEQEMPTTTSLRSQGVDYSLIGISLQEKMRKTLGMSKEQIERLSEQNVLFERLMRERNSKILFDESIDMPTKMLRVAKSMEEVNDLAAVFLDEVLTPTQRAAVTKQFFKDRFRNSSLRELFGDPGIAKFLAMNSDQQKAVLQLAARLDDEYFLEANELRKEKLGQVMNEKLSPDQRKKLEGLLEK